MISHLYNSKIAKIKFFIKRFGLREFFLKPLRIIFAPAIIAFSKKHYFNFKDKRYSLFYHKHNVTWAGERAIEIPIFLDFVRNNENKKILEVGNVLSNYTETKWDVLDKFEKKSNIINADVFNFKPKDKYDLVVSISTFEHIGYDDDISGSEDSYEKIKKSIENLKKNCLRKKGLIFFSVPAGYNKSMDKIIFDERTIFRELKFLKRHKKNLWKEVNLEEAKKSFYGKPFPYGNCIAFAKC